MFETPVLLFRRAFYELLYEPSFDRFVEDSMAELYASNRHRVLPPVSTFACSSSTTSKALRLNEAWRCRHSLSLQQFLEIKLTVDVPDHSSMTRIRDRYSLEVTENVFAFVLKLAADN